MASSSRAVSVKGVLGIAPHFEKMLCDNAQLAHVYLHAWQVTGNEFFRPIACETLDYVVREMTVVGAAATTSRCCLRSIAKQCNRQAS